MRNACQFGEHVQEIEKEETSADSLKVKAES
jgi:hypothetical protein